MRIGGLVMLLAFVTPQRVPAQQREGLDLDVLVGGAGTFQKLNESGTAYLIGGPFFGAVLDWAPSSVPGLAVLGEAAWTRHELAGSVTGAGTRVDLFTVGADLGYIYIDTPKFSSTFFGGGGALFLHEASSGATRLEPFSRLGLDARYHLSPRLALYAQVAAMIYTLNHFPGGVLAGYDHRQGDASIGAGVAVRF